MLLVGPKSAYSWKLKKYDANHLNVDLISSQAKPIKIFDRLDTLPALTTR